jgi:hypothetical protein
MSLVAVPGVPLSGWLDVAVQETLGDASQTSLAAFVSVMGTSLWFGGQRLVGDACTLIAGAVVSTTFTDVVQLDLLPAVSLALHATVVDPSENEPPPQLALQVWQLSVHVAKTE